MKVPPFSLNEQLSEIGAELDAAVLRVLHSGYYIGGEEVLSFEKSFAKSVGVSYSVSCNSGTDALILALRALEIGPGDEVITTSFSFFATAEAISNVGATPVFVEVDPKNYLIDLNKIEEAINSSTKAILPVHLFGCPVNMHKLMEIAKKNGLKVIEDCAQASGAEWEGKPVGSWGDVGCFSFFPTKNLGAAGDAGAATTQNIDLAKRMRELSVHGMPKRYFHDQIGYNSRLDALQAAILNVKLSKLSEWVERRQKIAFRYHNLLKNLPGLEVPFFNSNLNMKHAWNQFVVRVKEDAINTLPKDKKSAALSMQAINNSSSRDLLKAILQSQGVNTIIYYPIPIHLQPAYKHFGYKVGSLPLTERLCREVLSLPIYPELTEDAQVYVSEQVYKFFDQI